MTFSKKTWIVLMATGFMLSSLLHFLPTTIEALKRAIDSLLSSLSDVDPDKKK